QAQGALRWWLRGIGRGYIVGHNFVLNRSKITYTDGRPIFCANDRNLMAQKRDANDYVAV
ncbi:MAG: hypothetical protein O6757_07365, partial [Alphaproteobacteria bacterium]|nr:hypothetical protein [Alphaproteobacteria bacterium]